VEWQQSQDVDGWVADAALRSLVEWRADDAVNLRNHVHYLRTVMRTAGELSLDGVARPSSESPRQHS
jgi:hypothetical protein